MKVYYRNCLFHKLLCNQLISNVVVFSVIFLVPIVVSAQLVISEIMYDALGSDDGHEWIEVWNIGAVSVDLSLYRFYEAGVNHKLTAVLGSSIPSNGYAIIANDATKFQIDFPSFSGILYDSSFSLSNTGEVLSIKLDDSVIDSVDYIPDDLASGTGGTLQKIGSAFVALSATPGEPSDSANSVAVEANQASSDSSNNLSTKTDQTDFTGGFGTVADFKPALIIPDAGNDQTVVAGALALFSGRASIGGKPVPDTARFLWNFGDGATFIGQTTNHVYRSPGRYLATLSVSSGETSATDIVTINVVPSPISIASAVPGEEGYVSILNSSKGIVDISTWYLQSGNQVFVFPVGTFIAGSSVVRFDRAITGLSFILPEEVVLRFPSGKDASRGILDPKREEVAKNVESEIKSKVEKVETKGIQTEVDAPEKKIVIENTVDKNESNNFDSLDQEAMLEKSVKSASADFSGSLWWYGAFVLVLAFGTVGVIMIEKKKPVDEFEIIEADE